MTNGQIQQANSTGKFNRQIQRVVVSLAAFALILGLHVWTVRPAAAYIDPCVDNTYARLYDITGYRLPAATFNWNYHYNPWTTPPALSNPVAGQAIMAGGGGWNEKRTSSPACVVGGPSWTHFAQGVDVGATPGVADSWNMIGFQNFQFPAANTETNCRAALQGSPTALAVTCPWGTGGFASGTIYQADIVFNASSDWTTDFRYQLVNVQAVATHEFGHVVGLAHVAGETCSTNEDHWGLTMYRAYCSEVQGSYRQYTLGKGDMTGLFYVVN